LSRYLVGAVEGKPLEALAVDEATNRDRLADAVEAEREAAVMRKVLGPGWKL
jgi:hypothetical protein